MNQITVQELSEWQENGKEFLLLDVREDWERNSYNIGGMHLPMAEAMHRRHEIPQDKAVVVYCEKGIRSAIIIQRLEETGYQNLYNLEGGMKAWKAMKQDS